MVGVSTRIDGADRARDALNAAVRRLEDPLPLYTKIGDAVLASTIDRFDRETDPQGSPWAPSLRVMLEGGKTLTDTAVLRNSMTREADSQGVSIGTNDIRARIHQFGGTIRAKTRRGLRFRPMGGNQDVIRMSVNMPRRAFLGIDGDDELEIERLALLFVGEPLGEGGAAGGGIA